MSRLDEKRFKALGVEWIARFDFNATCAIEEETGESFYTVAAPFLAKMDESGAASAEGVLRALGTRHNSRIRLLLFHALSDAHDVRIEEVGKIIEAIGLAQATEVVLWAIERGIPFSGDEEAEGNAPAAPKAAPKPVAGNRKQRKIAARRG